MTCDPLQLAEQYIDRIKEIQSQVERVYARIPGTLEDLTQCLVFGTAERAGADLDPDSLKAYDLDSLERRVEEIFDAVEKGIDEVDDQITAHGDSETVDFLMATSGLWLSQDPAGTFYGLTAARTQILDEDVDEISVLVAKGQDAVDELRAALADLAGPQGQSLLEAARLWTEEICPEVSEIEAELRLISDGVASSQDLAASSCNAVPLSDRIRALMARVPNVGLEQVLTVVEATQKIREVATDLDVVQKRIEAVQDDLPPYEERMVAGGFTTQTEQRLPRAIADQFSEICQQIYALAEKDRWAEMVALGPDLREIAAIAITTLRQSPEWRVSQIQEHPIREDYDTWMRVLRTTSKPGNGVAYVDDMDDSLPSAIVDLSNDIENALDGFGQYLADMSEYGLVMQSGAEAFLGIADELLDVACTGALRVLLFELGYEDLEDLYAKGLFEDLPGAVYGLSTQTGRLIRCIGDALNGPARLVSLSPGQRLALEQANDILRTMEAVDHEVGNIARELDGWGRQPPVAHINDVAAILEIELKGGLRDLGVIEREIPNTQVSEDGFVLWKGLTEDGLPGGTFLDANGYLRAHPGAELPLSYTRLPNGYVTLPPGT